MAKENENVEQEVTEEIKKINPLEMTPIEAMNFLYKLKEKLR